jgi:hypothetical protein
MKDDDRIIRNVVIGSAVFYVLFIVATLIAWFAS